MHLTLDQARALDALARVGTFAAAAKALGKQHSAVVYAINQLEQQTGLALLDRSGYRTRLSAAGTRVLVDCRRLLAVADELEATCHTIRTGWEPRLRIVFDGLFPASAILRQVAPIAAPRTPTRVEVFAAFLSGVEAAFAQHEADLMVSVIPPQQAHLAATPLAPIPAYLVVHKQHPLARTRNVQPGDLSETPLLTVRGSDPRLQLSTAGLEPHSTIHLNDFHTKKEALLAGMGFGWMPGYLIEKELARGQLVKVRWRGASTHLFRPHVYHREDRSLGRAATAVVEGLRGR